MSKELLTNLIESTIHEGASDLHLLANRHPVIRVSGRLVPLVKQPQLAVGDTMAFLDELLTPEDKKIFLQNQEIDFSYGFKDKVRFRGNAYFEKGQVGIALRLIPKRIPTLEELNLPKTLEQFTKKQQGFFMVVGPMGHGKSTTLASLIELINESRAEHIITL